MSAVLAFSALFLAVPVAHLWVNPVNGQRWRALQWALTSLGVLSVPWWLPPEATVLRFFVAVSSVLAFMRLTQTFLGQHPRTACDSRWRYFWYFVFVGDIRLSKTRADKRQARRSGLLRFARGAFKAGCLLALFAVSTHWRDQLWDSFFAASIWCLWAGYVAATGGADLVSGLQMLVSGHGAAETFRSPPLSRSPRDFWGRRWNLVFRNLSHRILFQRAARGYGPLAAGAVVFVWSIVAHEYLVVASLGRTAGHMTAFFAIHGAVTLATSRFRIGRPWPLPLAIGAHWVWMLGTAPLFFQPILEVFHVQEWYLW